MLIEMTLNGNAEVENKLLPERNMIFPPPQPGDSKQGRVKPKNKDMHAAEEKLSIFILYDNRPHDITHHNQNINMSAKLLRIHLKN